MRNEFEYNTNKVKFFKIMYTLRIPKVVAVRAALISPFHCLLRSRTDIKFYFQNPVFSLKNECGVLYRLIGSLLIFYVGDSICAI